MNQTVPFLSILFMAVSACIAALLPVFLLIRLRRKYKAPLIPALVGALVFPLFVLVLESAAVKFLLGIEVVKSTLLAHGFLYAVFGGLMAGLFEETGRLVAFSFLDHRYGNVNGALMYGVGHGGMEAVLITALAMLNNLVLSLQINGAGGLQALVASVPALSPIAEQAAALYTEPPLLFLAGGLERIPAIAFHIAASVLVWLAASRRGPFSLYLLAIFFHTLLNFPAGLYQLGILTNIWVVELAVCLLAAVICVITFFIHRRYRAQYSGMLPYKPFRL